MTTEERTTCRIENGPRQRIKRKPLFTCQECGKKFYTTAAAERASFGDHGCPKCGGSDIDIAV